MNVIYITKKVRTTGLEFTLDARQGPSSAAAVLIYYHARQLFCYLHGLHVCGTR